MKMLRNPEVKRGLWLYIIASVCFSGIAFYMDADFGKVMVLVCTVFVMLHYMITYRRYRNISELAADINKILHGEKDMRLEQYAEGELGILQSEVSKMTVRLREQKQQLLDEKMYLADSIADISHQIRTPLTSINLLVSFLSEPNISEERRLKLTRELYGFLSRIDWLITTLLKISKLDAGTVQFKKETVSLRELINTSVSPLLIPIELRGQELQLKAEGNFYGDLSWTSEAIGNIVKNCMEHTPAEGCIGITASENPLFSEIIIEDSGSGIAKEDMPHIFERFYKGKDSEDKSFGIGLALARMIVVTQNGIIKAENRSAGGARFIIRFYKGTV